MLLFCDDSEALTHPYIARACARRGADLRLPAPELSEKLATFGAFDWARRRLHVTTSRSKSSADFIAHRETLDTILRPERVA